jgi:pimeloyl-ACP methyl ester carboxylesterase
MLLVYPITPLFMGILAKSWRIGFKKMGKAEAYRKYVGDVRAMKKKAVTRAVLALASTNLTDKLKNIKVPTMLLHGMADKYEVPIQAAKILEKNIENSKLYIVEQASHFAPIEQIDEVKSYFSEFLSNLKVQ